MINTVGFPFFSIKSRNTHVTNICLLPSNNYKDDITRVATGYPQYTAV